MSTIRFVHTDHLRLATALSGLAHSPAWLQQLATNCVRQAVRNVIDTAVARQAEFLLIAGSVTESGENLDAVTRWLDDQFATLRSHGIQVVTVAGNPETTAALEQISDIVLHRGQVLQAAHAADGSLRLSATSSPHTTTAALVVAVGEELTPAGQLVYHAVPALRPGTDNGQLSTDGRVAVSAGAVQTVNPTEQWHCGCVVAEARVLSSEIQTEVVPTDVLGFATDRVSLSDVNSIEDLIPAVMRASSALEGRPTRTLIVDWILQARVAADLSQAARLGGESLLAELRNCLHGGHQGVWPRSVTFSADSLLQLPDENAAVEEFFDVMHGPASIVETYGTPTGKAFLQGRSGVPAELIAGLSLLGRAA